MRATYLRFLTVSLLLSTYKTLPCKYADACLMYISYILKWRCHTKLPILSMPFNLWQYPNILLWQDLYQLNCSWNVSFFGERLKLKTAFINLKYCTLTCMRCMVNVICPFLLLIKSWYSLVHGTYMSLTVWSSSSPFPILAYMSTWANCHISMLGQQVVPILFDMQSQLPDTNWSIKLPQGFCRSSVLMNYKSLGAILVTIQSSSFR